MNVWDEGAVDAVRAVLWEKRDYVTAPDIMEALAPHLATRDAAVRREALEEAVKVPQDAARRLISNGRARVNQVDRHTAEVLVNQAKAIRALATDATP